MLPARMAMMLVDYVYSPEYLLMAAMMAERKLNYKYILDSTMSLEAQVKNRVDYNHSINIAEEKAVKAMM